MAVQNDGTALGRRRRGRRGNREGSIYLTTDGRWRGSILLPDGTGKYLRGTTRADVQQKLRRSLDEFGRTGKIVTAPQKLLLRDYLPAWLEQAKPGLLTSSDTSLARRRAGREVRLGQILESLGLQRIRQHDLRHSTAALLLERGISSMEVAILLGHPTTRLTDDRCGHLTARMTEATAAAMDTLKSRPPKS